MSIQISRTRFSSENTISLNYGPAFGSLSRRTIPSSRKALGFSNFFSQCAHNSCASQISKRSNINKDPRFVSAMLGNIHILIVSPC